MFKFILENYVKDGQAMKIKNTLAETPIEKRKSYYLY